MDIDIKNIPILNDNYFKKISEKKYDCDIGYYYIQHGYILTNNRVGYGYYLNSNKKIIAIIIPGFQDYDKYKNNNIMGYEFTDKDSIIQLFQCIFGETNVNIEYAFANMTHKSVHYDLFKVKEYTEKPDRSSAINIYQGVGPFETSIVKNQIIQIKVS